MVLAMASLIRRHLRQADGFVAVDEGTALPFPLETEDERIVGWYQTRVSLFFSFQPSVRPGTIWSCR